MDVVEDLLAQRDAVLFGTWTRGAPRNEDEACLLVRPGQGLGSPAVHYLYQAIGDELSIAHWNAEHTREEVVALLDEAIRLAKEDL